MTKTISPICSRLHEINYSNRSKVKLQKLMAMRVYDDISRVNHSCQPNAVVDCNEELQKGSLHAMVDVAEG